MSAAKLNQSFEPFKITELRNGLSKVSTTATLQRNEKLTQVLLKKKKVFQ